jgi:hypothetical protein
MSHGRGKIAKAVIRNIAESRRVSFKIAAEIYDLKPVFLKNQLCEREVRRQEKESVRGNS